MNDKVEKEVNAGQMVMFTEAALAKFDPSIAKVFGVKTTDKVAKDGRVLHTQTLAMDKRKDVALALELVGKANKGALDAKILGTRKQLMRGAKGEIAAYEDDVVFTKMQRKEMANGVTRFVWTFDQISLEHSAAELETIAKAFGITVKEVLAKIKAAEEKAAADAAKPVQATVTSEPMAQPVEPEKPKVETPDEKAARELAEEEAKRLRVEAEAQQGADAVAEAHRAMAGATE